MSVTAPALPCRQPGCPALNCTVHTDAYMRGTAASRGYGRDWRKLRNIHLKAEPFCRSCAAAGKATLATEVDHIIPVTQAPALRLSRDNLRSLCHACHMERHARD